MSLTDFFRINLPYGIRRNSENKWIAFNREYMPLGFNTTFCTTKSIMGEEFYTDLPVYTKYHNITEKALLKIAGSEDMVRRDKVGKIQMVFFYLDKTNPQTSPQYWDDYFQKIKLLSKFETRLY